MIRYKISFLLFINSYADIHNTQTLNDSEKNADKTTTLVDVFLCVRQAGLVHTVGVYKYMLSILGR